MKAGCCCVNREQNQCCDSTAKRPRKRRWRYCWALPPISCVLPGSRFKRLFLVFKFVEHLLCFCLAQAIDQFFRFVIISYSFRERKRRAYAEEKAHCQITFNPDLNGQKIDPHAH